MKQNKNTLAKLLASENVTVEHRKTSTAYFELNTRTIVLPVWKEMSNDLYDMFLGHEVGHALFTPEKGWHTNQDYGKNFKTYLNVVEDARIERKVKNKFPGIVKNFYKGYQELFDKDFFGVKDRDVNALPLIDRINLHYKVGSMLAIQFTDEEKEFLNRIDVVETWDEVVNVCKDLFDRASNDEGEQEALEKIIQQTMKQPEEQDKEEEEENPDFDDYFTSIPEDEDEEDEEEDNGSGQSQDSDEEQEEQEEQDESYPTSGGGMQGGEEEPVSITDQNFRNNEDKIIDKDALPPKYVTMPTKLDLDYFVTSINELLDTKWSSNMFVRIDESLAEHIVPIEKAKQILFKRFENKNKAYISALVQQFELRRQASQLKKARTSKTGELDVDKLWATRLTEDVFLSNTIIPKGKNHGMVFIIDFSGSMQNDIAATLEQVLIQAQFCKKVGIPFDVYSFTTGQSRRYRDENEEFSYEKHLRLLEEAQGGRKLNQLMIREDDIKINHLLSSNLNQGKYNEMFKTLLMVGASYSNHDSYYEHRYNPRVTELCCNGYDLPTQFRLGGTPLVETMVIATELVRKFRQQHKVEVMNTILLTDGGPTSELRVECGKDKYFDSRNYNGFAIQKKGKTIIHKGEKYYTRDKAIQYELVKKWFKQETDSRLINFHIGRFGKYDVEREFTEKYGWSKGEKEFQVAWKKDWLRNGFVELTDFEQYDSKFIIKNGKNIQVSEDELEVKSNKKGDLLRGFKKFQGNKNKTRVFVNRFIEKVA